MGLWEHLKGAAVNVSQAIGGWVLNVYNQLITAQLRDLYFNGPNFGGVGFWAGKEEAEICHELSPLSSVSFWRSHRDECVNQIENKFHTFVYTVNIAIYFFFLYRTYCFVNWLFWFVFCYSCRRRRRTHFIPDHLLLE